MEKKEAFKEFVKTNPKLLKHVNDGSMNWQKFYELYDIYGSEHTIWDQYLKNEEITKATTAGVLSGIGLGEIANFLKNIDLDSVQTGIGNIQRVLGVLQDFGTSKEVPKEPKPRPLYKHFED